MSGKVTLGQLQAMGLHASNPLVKRDITIKYNPLKPRNQWRDSEVPERQEDVEEAQLEVYLRKFTAADRIAISAAKSNNEIAYIAIQRTTFQDDGQPVFPTMDDAYGLDLEMFAPLIAEIFALNNFGGKAKKSQPRMKRGANSRSPSAAEALPNGSKSSLRKSSTSGSSTENATVP